MTSHALQRVVDRDHLVTKPDERGIVVHSRVTHHVDIEGWQIERQRHDLHRQLANEARLGSTA